MIYPYLSKPKNPDAKDFYLVTGTPVHKPHVKMLQLDGVFACRELAHLWRDDIPAMGWKAIHPVMFRDGWFYCRHSQTAWREIDGEAWVTDKEEFLYSLRMFEVEEHPLRPCERDAIKTLVTARLASKEQEELLRLHEQAVCANEVYRRTRMEMNR